MIKLNESETLDRLIPRIIKDEDFSANNEKEVQLIDFDSRFMNRDKEVTILPDLFTKCGMLYKMINRNDTVIIYALSLNGTMVGYEVSLIVNLPEQKFLGKTYPQRETLPSDEKFGLDGSKAFFPNELQRALRYFDELTLLNQGKQVLPKK